MSGIAKVLLAKGFSVTGSDIKDSPNIVSLRKLGAKIVIGHNKDNISGADVIVISSAIKSNNVELQAAQERNNLILKRAEMVALMAEGSNNIAVSGTHGKTTTTSMISVLLESAGLDPTFLIGGELNDIGSNAKFGRGEDFIIEADESDSSFLFLKPNLAVITNIEEDHLDHFESLDDIMSAFSKFVSLISGDGNLVIFSEHPNNLSLIDQVRGWESPPNVVTYGFEKSCDYRATEIELKTFGSAFRVVFEGEKSCLIELSVPGLHNVANALAAFSVGRILGIDMGKIAAGLKGFSGVKRRFQLLGTFKGAFFVDDYAHHPSEVEATLKSAKSGEWTKIFCVFQPHRYSRTKSLSERFGLSFADADRIIITDVYGAGETAQPGVTGKLIADAILKNDPAKDVIYLPTKMEVKTHLSSVLSQGDLVITMGAGDIHTVGEDLIGSRF